MFYIIATFIVSSLAAPIDELVTILPGVSQLTFGMYSGYIDIEGTTKKIHYILAESKKDRTKDPLIVWFNGGPGCSSMLAFT
jgi:hypothetical protein